MEDISLEEVMKKYKLPQEEHDRIGKEVQKIWLNGKKPVDNPTVMIILGPPGSGKTGLDGYSSKYFEDGNVVVINSDEIKTFQPGIGEVAKKYPQYYTQVSGQESKSWTQDLFENALKQKYNLVFELTGKNAEILNSIKQQMQEYKVVVRGMAVSDLNCLLSILERYEYQVQTRGWGRLVAQKHFDEAYSGMPETIDLIEKSGLADAVEIYMRGEEPSDPIKIYSSKNENKYQTAQRAILECREKDYKNASASFEDRINNICTLMKGREDSLCQEEKTIIEYAKEIYEKKRQESLKDELEL